MKADCQQKFNNFLSLLFFEYLTEFNLTSLYVCYLLVLLLLHLESHKVCLCGFVLRNFLQVILILIIIS